MDLIDQLSTYIYVYVDNYQNKMYSKKIMKFFLPWIECLPIYGKDEFAVGEYIQL